MKGFAYRDKHGILHVVDSEESAKIYAGGEIKEVDVDHEGGYPCVEDLSIIDYGDGKVYIGGNLSNGTPISKAPVNIAEKARKILDKIGL